MKKWFFLSFVLSGTSLFALLPPLCQSAKEIDADSMKHFRKLYHELLERGIYLGPSGYEVGFVSEAHTEEDLKKAGKIIVNFLKVS